MRTVNSMWFTSQDVQIIFDVAQTKAYEIIKELASNLVEQGYARPPHGKIQKKFLCERYQLDQSECEEILAENKKTA